MGKIAAMIAGSKCRGHKHNSMPPSSMSDCEFTEAAVAFALSDKDEKGM